MENEKLEYKVNIHQDGHWNHHKQEVERKEGTWQIGNQKADHQCYEEQRRGPRGVYKHQVQFGQFELVLGYPAAMVLTEPAGKGQQCKKYKKYTKK